AGVDRPHGPISRRSFCRFDRRGIMGIFTIGALNGVYALPDPLLYLLSALALWLAVHALLTPDKRAACVVWSTIASLLAIIIKYTVVPVLLPGVMAALWLTWKQRKHSRYLLLQIALIAVVGV